MNRRGIVKRRLRQMTGLSCAIQRAFISILFNGMFGFSKQPARRTVMKFKMIVCSAVAAAVLAGCSSVNSSGTALTALPQFSHPRDITNPYLPLASLKQDVLQNEKERVERTARPEIHKTFQVGGQTVGALTVEDREFNAGGELIEATRDYFAQDDDGNVYYMGEDVDEYSHGKISGHSGAWLFGKDTQKLGLLMPAHPKIGDKFKSEDAPPITWEQDEIISASETATVPAGTFQNCVKIKEIASDGDTEYKLYAPGVGCVEEIEVTTPLPLQSHSTN
jgi:hypothetical protein